MDNDHFKIAYSAQIQVDRLPGAEKQALSRLFSSDEISKPDNTQPTSAGRFVSRLGSKHVLWQRSEKGRPEILSIVDRSYAE